MECKICKGTVIKKVVKNYIVHLPYKGKIESYTTDLVLYSCLKCGYDWWDESLPDPKVDAILQYIEHHGREDRESKSLIKRFSL